MKSFFYKTSAIVLLVASGIPFALVMLFFVKQHTVRHEMKERLEKQILHTITLSKADVHWIKKNKEILVKEKMFDVKSLTIENDLYTFTGLYDEEETELANQLEKNFNKNNTSGSWLISNLFQWLQSVYPDNNSTEITFHIPRELNPPFIYIRLSSPYKIILTPPPQAC